jgi:hypothetical protein
MYDWAGELGGYFDSNASEKFDDGVAASKLNREIEDFLVETAIPAFDGLKKKMETRNRSLHIDKEKHVVSVAVRFGDITEFVYKLSVMHSGHIAVAVKQVGSKESIIEPQASKNDNSIASLTMDDIRSSFVFEYIAAMSSGRPV